MARSHASRQGIECVGEIAQLRLSQDRFVSRRDASELDEDAREALGVGDRIFELRPIAPTGVGADNKDVALQGLGARRGRRHERRQHAPDNHDRDRSHRRLSF